MKVRELKSRLARGMGDALLYLYENRGTDRFDDVIVEVCSKFTNVNFQSDGGNEAYYAQAIRTSSNQQALLERLKQKLLSSKRFDDIVRINLILYCFSEDEGTVSFCTDRYLEYFEKALLFDDSSGAVNHYGESAAGCSRGLPRCPKTAPRSPTGWPSPSWAGKRSSWMPTI